MFRFCLVKRYNPSPWTVVLSQHLRKTLKLHRQSQWYWKILLSHRNIRRSPSVLFCDSRKEFLVPTYDRTSGSLPFLWLRQTKQSWQICGNYSISLYIVNSRILRTFSRIVEMSSSLTTDGLPLLFSPLMFVHPLLNNRTH